MQKTQIPPYNACCSNLCSCNLFENKHTDYINQWKSALTTEQAVIKLKLSKSSPTGIENYHYLQQIWKQDQMRSLKDILQWYNNKDVPILEPMQKMVAFYHDKDIDMLKLGCTLPNLAKICLQNSTHAKFYPLTEEDKGLLENIREDVVGGPYIVFTRIAVVDETFFPKVYKPMHICCWDWCQPSILILDVSSHAHRSLYALGYRFRNQ